MAEQKQKIGEGVVDGQVIGAISFRDVATPRGQGRVYEIPFSDGKSYSTFNVDLANKAQGFQGQSCSLQYEHTRKGQYDNYGLKDIGPLGSFGAATGGFVPPATVVPVEQTFPPPANGVPPIVDKDARIVRGNAANAAAAIVGHMFEAGAESDIVLATFNRFATEIVRFIKDEQLSPGSEAAAVTVGAPKTTGIQF